MNSSDVTPDSDHSFCGGRSESFLKLSPIQHSFKQRLQPKKRSESPVSALSIMPTLSFTSIVSPLNLHTLTNDSTAPLDELYIRTERDCDEIEKVMRRYKKPRATKRERTSSESMGWQRGKLELKSEIVDVLRQSMMQIDEEYQFTEVYDEETLCKLFKQATECLKARAMALERHRQEQDRSKTEVIGLKQKILIKEQEILKLERQAEKSIKTCDSETKKLACYKASLEKREKRMELDCEALKLLQNKYEERKKKLRLRELTAAKKEEALKQLETARTRDKVSVEALNEQNLKLQASLNQEIEQLSSSKVQLQSEVDSIKGEILLLGKAKQELAAEYGELQSKMQRSTEEVRRLTSKALDTDRQIRGQYEDQCLALEARFKKLKEKEKQLKLKEVQLCRQSNELEKLGFELSNMKKALESEKEDRGHRYTDKNLAQEADKALKAAEQQIAFLEKSVADLRKVVENNEATWEEHRQECTRREQELEQREADIKKQQSLLDYAERQLEAECCNIKDLWSQQFELLYKGYDPVKEE
mmetsp:Transcript_27184/g.48809  ORF Transcript_27184/g.48809 Transcript_27184/m.48809 type:complete len:533 (-) Transcript_27184:35-1633(-)